MSSTMAAQGTLRQAAIALPRPLDAAGRLWVQPRTALFGLTLFMAASLLFCVQPMVARMVLPALGGSPAVWNTCMVFFQAALLAGYAYAHGLTSWLGLRGQLAVHGLVILAPLLILPIALGLESTAVSPPSDTSPVFWLLATLLRTVGLPFFVIATTAPLLQRWFARTSDPANADPYFLYGASNLGSMSALLAYPLLVEPNLRLARQSGLWSTGQVILTALVFACGFVVWRSTSLHPAAVEVAVAPRADEGYRIGLARWLRWVWLSFVPSSLMLGVTAYLSTDIAAIPLLWVVPLALYLLTFIVVFARRPVLSTALTTRCLPVMVVWLAWLMIIGAEPGLGLMLVHLATFFVVALVCHGQLAADRPPVRALTSYYLAMSIGGVLGGVFNALVAPAVFDRILEYPLALVLGCLALPLAAAGAVACPRRERLKDVAWPCALGLATAGLVWLIGQGPAGRVADVAVKLTVGGALAIVYILFRHRPARLALGLGALLMVGGLTAAGDGRVLRRERSFFGVLKVIEDARGDYRRLVHGNTLHGQQSLDATRRDEPLSYYHRSGPFADVYQAFSTRPARPSVGVVGLGAGSLACYGVEGQRWTFYEIDPDVARIARDPRFFTFLRDCRAGEPSIILGDARLRLHDAGDGAYGLLVLDAFSSDAIPLHLLTREALGLYRAKVASDGLIAMHISNRYLDLAPVVSALARDAGMVCRVRADVAVSPEQVAQGKSASIWAVLAARVEDLGLLRADPRWRTPQSRATGPVWADDYSDIVRHLTGFGRMGKVVAQD
jgi:spermidine synthase